MSKNDNAVEAFIAAIKDTDEYKEYVIQKEKVKQYPELKAQIDEFRSRNYELQMSEEPAFDTLEQFEKEYEDFRENILVSDFLAAELAFCRMMQDMNNCITEAVQFE